jgi:hypothetical protein
MTARAGRFIKLVDRSATIHSRRKALSSFSRLAHSMGVHVRLYALKHPHPPVLNPRQMLLKNMTDASVCGY